MTLNSEESFKYDLVDKIVVCFTGFCCFVLFPFFVSCQKLFFLTHFDKVFLSIRCFEATSLFEGPLCSSFHAAHFSFRDLFTSFHFCAINILLNTGSKKEQTFEGFQSAKTRRLRIDYWFHDFLMSSSCKK